jgi:hypothetical protein
MFCSENNKKMIDFSHSIPRGYVVEGFCVRVVGIQFYNSSNCLTDSVILFPFQKFEDDKRN